MGDFRELADLVCDRIFDEYGGAPDAEVVEAALDEGCEEGLIVPVDVHLWVLEEVDRMHGSVMLAPTAGLAKVAWRDAELELT